jgi:hypothetical protein
MADEIRVEIRLDAQIAPLVQAAADRDGVSVEAWVTRATRQAVQADAAKNWERDDDVIAELDAFHDGPNQTLQLIPILSERSVFADAVPQGLTVPASAV